MKKPESTNGCKSFNLPNWLRKIPFGENYEWEKAHKKAKEGHVIAAAIAAYRKAYLLSLDEAAKRLGVSRSTLAGWESGKRQPNWQSKKALIMSGAFSPAHLNCEACYGE